MFFVADDGIVDLKMDQAKSLSLKGKWTNFTSNSSLVIISVLYILVESCL